MYTNKILYAQHVPPKIFAARTENSQNAIRATNILSVQKAQPKFSMWNVHNQNS